MPMEISNCDYQEELFQLSHAKREGGRVKSLKMVVTKGEEPSSSDKGKEIAQSWKFPNDSQELKPNVNAMDFEMTSPRTQSKLVEDKGNLPWVEKYRPCTLDNVIHHTDIISTLLRFLKEGKLPHLLFYGPPGTGKTSTAVALAHDIFGDGKSGMVLELNASDERGISVVREQIKTFAATKTLSMTNNNGGMVGTSPTFKLIILDECDAMTGAAQNALRRVMEKYIRNVRFIIICNYVGQIIPALQSRCTRFRFSPLPNESLRVKIDMVAQKEGLNISENAKEAIIKLAGGDMRRILNVLQAASAASGADAANAADVASVANATNAASTVNAPASTLQLPLSISEDRTKNQINDNLIYSVTASPHPSDLKRIFHTLLNQTDFTSAISVIKQIQITKGLALMDILKQVFDLLAEITLPEPMRIFLTKTLADIEYRLAQGSTESIQLSAMVGAFFVSRTFIVKA